MIPTQQTTQTMRNYLRNKPNYSDLLMSAVTFQDSSNSSRYKGTGDRYSKHDGICLNKEQQQSFLELKYRKYNMSYFEQNPPLIELKKYLHLKSLEKAFYVNFVEQEGKTIMLSWDMQDETIFTSSAPQPMPLPFETLFSGKHKVQKQVMYLNIDKATQKDVTSLMYNNLPLIIQNVYNSQR